MSIFANCLIMMSELEVRPKLRFWAKMSMKQTQKIGLQRIQLLPSRIPYKWYNKHVRLLNFSIFMFELEVRPKLRFWATINMK